MSKRHVNKMPTIAVVGLCFGLLAFALTIMVASSVGFVGAFLGFVFSIGAIALFGGVVATWVFS